jgi:hypothetical protein
MALEKAAAYGYAAAFLSKISLPLVSGQVFYRQTHIR